MKTNLILELCNFNIIGSSIIIFYEAFLLAKNWIGIGQWSIKYSKWSPIFNSNKPVTFLLTRGPLWVHQFNNLNENMKVGTENLIKTAEQFYSSLDIK